jgi:hypothetical protein
MRKRQINNFRLFESLNYGEWIPCHSGVEDWDGIGHQQLPEDGQEVLVYLQRGGTPDRPIHFELTSGQGIYVAKFKSGIENQYNMKKKYGWILDCPGYTDALPAHAVTHWMSLPEKP